MRCTVRSGDVGPPLRGPPNFGFDSRVRASKLATKKVGPGQLPASARSFRWDRPVLPLTVNVVFKLADYEFLLANNALHEIAYRNNSN